MLGFFLGLLNLVVALDFERVDLLVLLTFLGVLLLFVDLAALVYADQLTALILFVLGRDLAFLVVVVNVDHLLLDVELGLFDLRLS